MPERQYNFIFSKLVEKDDDMLGLLAYGLYKQQKIEYIAQFKKEHGRGPSHEELATFHDLTSSPTQIENYKQLAEIRLNSIEVADGQGYDGEEPSPPPQPPQARAF